jgi:hypothetical protein
MLISHPYNRTRSGRLNQRNSMGRAIRRAALGAVAAWDGRDQALVEAPREEESKAVVAEAMYLVATERLLLAVRRHKPKRAKDAREVVACEVEDAKVARIAKAASNAEQKTIGRTVVHNPIKFMILMHNA